MLPCGSFAETPLLAEDEGHGERHVCSGELAVVVGIIAAAGGALAAR